MFDEVIEYGRTSNLLGVVRLKTLIMSITRSHVTSYTPIT